MLLLSSSSSLSFDDVVGGGGSSRGCREFKYPKIIPYTEPTMMTKRIKPRSWSGTPRTKDNMKFHTFSDATLFFDDVGAVDIIGGVHHRPWRGIGGNIATASAGVRMMTIALLLSSVACDSHAFALAGRPFARLRGRHRLMIPGGGDGGGADNNDLYVGIISKGGGRQWQRQPAALAAGALAAAAVVVIVAVAVMTTVMTRATTVMKSDNNDGCRGDIGCSKSGGGKTF